MWAALSAVWMLLAGSAAFADPPWASGPSGDEDTCCGLFSHQSLPTKDKSKLKSPIELGMRFRAKVDGYVTHLAYFESKFEKGPQAASLWTADGQLLARVPIADHGQGAQDVGWVIARLPNPVPLFEGETYVVSRTSPGRFPYVQHAFTGHSVQNAHLIAPAHTPSAPNGVTGPAGSFPTQGSNGDNFFVDVVFQPGDVRPPVVTIQAPAEGATVEGMVTISGTATDASGIARVEVQIDGGPLTPAAGTSAWSFAWDTTQVPNGVHTLAVVATDNAGFQSTVTRTVTTLNVPRFAFASSLGLSATEVPAEVEVEANASVINEGTVAGTLGAFVVAAWAPDADPNGPPTRFFVPFHAPLQVGAGQTASLTAKMAFSYFDAMGDWRVAAGFQDASGDWTWSPAVTLTRIHRVALGTAVHNGRLFDPAEPLYQDTFLSHFDGMTAEFEMKWAQLQPQPGQFNFQTADKLVEFAVQNGKTVRGHTLVWHNSLPSWVTGVQRTREQAIDLLVNYITTVVGRYRGIIPEWDVVNEAFNDDGTYRQTYWYNTIGPDYLAIAFHAAHAADPDARLYYNDFNAERIGTKSTAILNAMKELKAAGVPVHGVGFQAHVSFNFFPTQQQLQDNLARFGAAGFLTQVTELDVRTSALAGTIAEKFEKQAEVYRGIAAACQATPTCVRVTTWGITDRHTFHPAGEMPLPFDTLYLPKPAFFALHEELLRDNRPPAPKASPAGPRLRELGEQWGVRVGAAVKTSAINLDSDFRTTLVREFNLLTPEFEMKMATVQPARGTFDFSRGKQLVSFAKTHGLAVHGHTLVWHKSLPEWLDQVPVAEREAVLHLHVEKTVEAFAGDVLVWDVVNEALNDDGSWRDTVWYQAIGPDYVARAFHWARAKDPAAKLIYSDYGIETINAKSTAVYNMVKNLRAAGIPIDGIGIQAHLTRSGLNLQSFADNLARFADLGVEIYITQMDVALNDSPPTQADLEAQAAVYRGVLDTILLQPAVKEFTVWGLADHYSWQAPHSPLLFDGSFQAKPSYFAVQSAFVDGGFSGFYRLLAKSSQKVMSVENQSLNNAARVIQLTDTGHDSQRWFFAHLGGGAYHIVNKHSGRAVKTLNGSTAPGAVLEQFDRTTFDSLKWRPVYVGNGYYKLVSPIHGLNIRVKDGSLAEGAPLDQAAWTGADNHKWMIQPRN